MSAETERVAIRKQWPAEFDDGVRSLPGGYPKGFHAWPLARRNVWFAGFNIGHFERHKREAADG